MAGLVVIDFIDMEYNSNIRKVEKAMKDALKNDRARIQVGRISGFGLMEMSRQRLRTGVLEATTRECPHCDGTGLVRTASSAGLSALRLIEDEAAKGKGTIIKLGASTEAAVYLLNEKRHDLVEIEHRYGVTVEVTPEGEDEGAKMSVSSHGPRPAEAPKFDPIVIDEEDDEEEIPEENEADEDDGQPRKKRRRRRRGGRGRSKNGGDGNSDGSEDSYDDDDRDSDRDSDRDGETSSDDDDDNADSRPKRRRRRGGRGRRKKTHDTQTGIDADKLEEVSEQVREDVTVVTGPDDAPETAAAAVEAEAPAEEKPKRKRAPRKKKPAAGADEVSAEAEAGAETAPAEEKPAATTPRKRAPRKKKDEAAPVASEAAEKKPAKPRARAKPKKDDASAETASQPASNEDGSDDNGESKKRGWWQRTFGE